MFYRPLAFLLILLLMPAALAKDPGWVQDSEVLHQLIVDQTHYRGRVGGGLEIEYQAPDGRTAYLLDGCLYRGKWWIEDNVVCYAYPELTGTQRSCFWLRQVGDSVEFWDVSVPEATEPTAVSDKIVPGNAENLAFDGRGGCQDI